MKRRTDINKEGKVAVQAFGILGRELVRNVGRLLAPVALVLLASGIDGASAAEIRLTSSQSKELPDDSFIFTRPPAGERSFTGLEFTIVDVLAIPSGGRARGSYFLTPGDTECGPASCTGYAKWAVWIAYGGIARPAETMPASPSDLTFEDTGGGTAFADLDTAAAPAATVPEPAALLLFATGLFSVVSTLRARRSGRTPPRS